MACMEWLRRNAAVQKPLHLPKKPLPHHFLHPHGDAGLQLGTGHPKGHGKKVVGAFRLLTLLAAHRRSGQLVNLQRPHHPPQIVGVKPTGGLFIHLFQQGVELCLSVRSAAMAS